MQLKAHMRGGKGDLPKQGFNRDKLRRRGLQELSARRQSGEEVGDADGRAGWMRRRLGHHAAVDEPGDEPAARIRSAGGHGQRRHGSKAREGLATESE